MKLTHEQVEKLVNFWSEKIRSPVFNGLSNEERKDPQNDAYQMGEDLARSFVQFISDEQLEVFKKTLTNELQDLEQWQVALWVDYHPTELLVKVAEQSGIPLTNFPWKTHTSINVDGEIKVQCQGLKAFIL